MEIGRLVFGTGSAALGAIGLAFGAFAFAWQPIPPDLPGYTALAYAVGLGLVGGGLGLLFKRSQGVSAALIGLAYFIFALPWMVRVVRFPQMFGVWGGLAEQISLMLAAFLLWRAARGLGASRAEAISLKAYGFCAVVFGFNHFFSLEQTASMVPQWLPPGRMFWAVATGVFHCAAGVAIIAGVGSLVAARLLAIMMLGFEALVWLPALVKEPIAHLAWAGNGTDVVLAGAALVIADVLMRKSKREAAVCA